MSDEVLDARTLKTETLRRVNEEMIGVQFGEKAGEPHPVWAAIYKERVRRRMGITRLANMAGVSSSTVSRGERGFGTGLTAMLKVLEVLDMDLVAVPKGTTNE